MNRKQLGILLVLVVAFGAAGLVLYNKKNASWESSNPAAGKKLLADLPVNDITHIAIKQGTNEVNLVKKDDMWRVSERNDYPANFSQISGFLLKARDLKAVQTEQVGPSQLPRLDLATGSGTNSATVVEFHGDKDKPLNTLLLGKQHMQKPKQPSPYGGDEGWPDGRYVKLADAKFVAVINDPLSDVEPKADTWLDKDFFKVQKAKSVEVSFPEATNSWKLTRETETGTWKLADAKADEKLDSSKTSGVSDPFSSPSFNDVLPGNKLSGTGTNQPTVVKIGTFDNFDYTINVGEKTNDDYLLTMAVSGNFPTERTPGKDEKPADKEKLDKEFKDNLKKLQDKLKQEQGYANWTYMVPSWTVDPLLKHRSELLEEKKPETSATNAVSSVTAPPTKVASAVPAK